MSAHVGPNHYAQLIRHPAQRRLLTTVLLQLDQAGPEQVVRYPGNWFPQQPNGPTDKQLYHYWVIRYLSQRLVEQRHAPTAAFVAPFLLNTEYELMPYTMSRDASAGPVLPSPTAAWKGLQRPMQEHDVGAAELEHDLRHMYAGYRGALDGAGLRQVPLTYEVFAARMKTDTIATMQQLVAPSR